MGPTYPRLHLYQLYGLFGIRSDRWLTCLPLQTSANHEESLEISQYVTRHR